MGDGVRIDLPGTPVGKGRPRVVKGGQRTYTPRKTAQYERALTQAARAVMVGREPLDGPVAVEITACLPIPKSWPKYRRADAELGLLYPQVKPDVDNIAKLAKDAMNSIVYRDDSQVAELLTRKVYSADPCLVVLVELVDG